MRQSPEWRQQRGSRLEDRATTLAERGRQALNEILPNECVQLAGGKNRRDDAALLFLLFPLNVIADEDIAGLVCHDISKYLAREHRIRRPLRRHEPHGLSTRVIN